MSRFEQITLDGNVDDGNSSSTPLGIAGVFTGTAIDITDCGIVFINIYTDQASATDGLELQQSVDGTNWDHSDAYTIAAGATKNYSVNPHAKYFRVMYTNGAIAQTTFRLQTVLKTQNAKASSHRIKDEIIGDDDCTLMKAALTGENGNGQWHNVKTTADGNLQIVDESSGLSIAMGNVAGTTFVHKFGDAPDFDTADGEITIWDGAQDGTAWELMNYVFSTTADIDSLSSSSAADTQDITITGLDSNYNEVVQTVTLNGQTRVALTTSLIRVYRVFNDNSVDLAGHVFVYVNGSTTGGVPDTNADIRAIVDPLNQQTEMVVYTVPNGKTAYMRSWYMATSGGNKASSYVIKLKSRNTGKVFRTKHTSALSEISPVPYQHRYDEPEIFEAKTDIIMTVESIASPASTGNAVSAGFDLILVDN